MADEPRNQVRSFTDDGECTVASLDDLKEPQEHVTSRKRALKNISRASASTQSSSSKISSSSSKNISIQERISSFAGEGFVKRDGLMFCTFCHHGVNHTEISTIKNHLKSKKHIN